MARRANNTGTIIRRGDGRLQGAIQISGTRRTVYGTTEREVSKKLDALRMQAVAMGGLPSPGVRTVNDLLDAWFAASRATLRPLTIDDYTAVSLRHIRPAIGGIRLSRLDPVHVQRLYADLQVRGLARIPEKVHTILHRAFRLAVLWRWLPENPCDRVVRPTYVARRREIWTEAQLRTFLCGTADHRLGSLWAFLVSTGCRIGEALALHWEDVDGEVVHVRRTLHRIAGEWVIGEPKTQAGQRTITLPQAAIDALRRQRARQAEYRLRAGAAWPDTYLVFTTSAGHPVHGETVAIALRKVCERLSLPPLSPHGFRHLHASLLIARGLSIPAVSARLGHSKVSVTLDVYAHVIGGEDRHAADVIGAAMASVG